MILCYGLLRKMPFERLQNVALACQSLYGSYQLKFSQACILGKIPRLSESRGGEGGIVSQSPETAEKPLFS